MTELLYTNSAIGNKLTQSSWSLATKAHRYTSMFWLRRSVYPSICGWNAVDICGQIPDNCSNSFQTSNVNLESRSDTITVGRPWCLHTSRTKMTARSAAIFPSYLSRRKRTILVNRSMITQSWSQFSETGSSVMKSMGIDCKGAYASSRGENRLYG